MGGPPRQALLLGGGIGIFGAALFAFSATTIHAFVDAVLRRAPIIIWDEGGWIALPIGLALLVVATALLVGRNHRPDVGGPRSTAIKRLLALAACLLPLAIAVPLSAHWLAGRHLEPRGYTACGSGGWIAAGRMPDREAALARCEVD